MALLLHRCCRTALSVISRGANNSSAAATAGSHLPWSAAVDGPHVVNNNIGCTSQNTIFVSNTKKFSTLTTNSFGNFKRQVHTKSAGDQQFIEFLSTEIEAEGGDIAKEPVKVSGFTVEVRGPKIRLTQKQANETCTVELNVTGSVDVEDDIEEEMSADAPPPEMVARPDFDITLEKNGSSSKLCLKCRLTGPSLNEDKPEDEVDNFEIVELAMVEGEWDENTYFVNADILDPTMYDMLMLMLEERGINHTTFCEELIDLSTDAEHKTYLNMLRSLQNYLQK